MSDGMKRREFLKRSAMAGWGIGAASLLQGCKSKSVRRPNILFIMTDQQHAGMMSCTGNRDLYTPSLDRLALSGIRFEKAYATNPVCMPARFSFQTGLMPSAIGMRKNQMDITVPHEMLENSLGVLLRQAGYDCAYGGKKHLLGNMDTYLMENGYTYIEADERNKLAESCARFLKQPRTKPFFLFASFINPHDICYMALNDYRREVYGEPAYENIDSQVCEAALTKLHEEQNSDSWPPLPDNLEVPPQEPEGITADYLDERPFRRWARENWSNQQWRLHRALYARLTEMVDEQIGVVLDALESSGQLDKTLIIFTSDHGDMDGAHRLEHKSILYEESVRVPFLMSWPNVIASRRVDHKHFVSSGLDLLPTILDYAEAKTELQIPGRSLRPLAEGKKIDRWRDSLILESQNGRMIITEQYKYCIYESGDRPEMLVDLHRDPGEMQNLAYLPEHKQTVSLLRTQLRKWAEDHNDTLALSYV